MTTAKIDSPSVGPFEFAWFCRHNGEPIQTIADVVETLTLSTEKSARAELYGVCLAERDEQGKQIVVCYTGNGPRSAANAQLITQLLSDYRTTAAAVPASTSLVKVATGAWHLLESLLAVRDGIPDDSIRTMAAALRVEIDKAEGGNGRE